MNIEITKTSDNSETMIISELTVEQQKKIKMLFDKKRNKTMTIKERAYQYARQHDNPASWFTDLEQSYIRGAEEQKKIDIERACKWICYNCENSSGCDGNSPYTCPKIQTIRKEMSD